MQALATEIGKPTWELTDFVDDPDTATIVASGEVDDFDEDDFDDDFDDDFEDEEGMEFEDQFDDEADFNAESGPVADDDDFDDDDI